MSEGEKALAKLDGAMSAIKTSVVDATGAGLRGGLAEASKSVTDVVDRVAAMANGTAGTLSPSANKNPLAQIMQDEAADEHREKYDAADEEREDHKSRLTLENKLDTMKQIAGRATGMDLGEKRGGDDDEGSFQFQAQLQGVLPHEAMHAAAQGQSVNLREIAANAASHVIAKADHDPTSAAGEAAAGLVRGEDAKTIAESLGGGFGKLGDLVTSAVNASTPVGPFNGIVNLAMGAAGADGLVDKAKGAIGEGLSGAKEIFDPANVANIAMNAATMAPQNLVNNVREIAGQLDPANVVANVTEKLGSFDASTMISNIGGALDPSNLGKLVGAMNPTNLVGIAGQALDNVTTRLREAADTLNPNAIRNDQLEIRDPATGQANGKRAHEPVMPSVEQPAGDPNKIAKPQDQANKSDIKQEPGADPKGMKPSDLAAKPSDKAGDKADKLDEKAGAATDKGDKKDAKDHAKDIKDAKDAKADKAEAHKKLDEAGDGKHDKSATKHAAEAAHKGQDAQAAKGAASATANAGTATAAGAAAAKSTGAAAATANAATGQAAPARGPNPAPTSTPQSARPAAERAKAATPATRTPSGKNAAPVTPGSGGAIQVNPQAVGSAPAQDVAQTEKVVTQPNVTIEARGDSAALPGMPADLASQTPTTAATQAGAAAGAKAAAAPSSATQAPTRTVAPLAPVAAAPTAAPTQAPPTAVTMPTIKGAGAAAGAAVGAAAATATPQAKATSGATQAGAQAVPANAKAAPPPAAQPLPAQKATPGTAAPQTPSTQAPAPEIPPVRAPGGDGAPSPAGMVPQTANLSADRTNAQQQLTAEAQTQSKVGPEANTMKQSQVASQKPALEQTKRSGDAPRQQAVTSSTTQGQQAGAAGKQRSGAAAQSGSQQIQGQGQAAQAQNAQLQSTSQQQSQSVMQSSSPSVMQGAAAPAQAAVAAAAAATRAQQAVINPAAVARAGQAGATNAQLAPFDGSKFGSIDAQLAQPMPEMDSAAADAGKLAADQTYQQAGQQIEQLANIQPPAINAPQSAGAGQKTKDGQPSREAAIANVEQQVSAQMSAQGPAKMQEAARPLQQEVKQHATSAQQAATTSADSQLQQHKAQEQQIKQQQPPTTGAQAAAAAQPQYAAHQAQATAAQASMQAEIASAQTAANAQTQQAKTARDASIQQGQQQYQTQSTAAQQQYTQDQQTAKTAFDGQNVQAQQAMQTDQQQAQTAAQQQTVQAQQKNDADIAQQNAQLASQQQAANASHQQQMEAANQQHDAQVQQAQAQMDSDVQTQQSQMQSQVSAEQTRGQQEVDRNLQEGEQGYQREIQAGEQQAAQEKARAEAEAAEKERQAKAEKDKDSGGVFGKVVGWVQDRFNDAMNAVKSVLAAARDLIVSIMEKARQAALAVLNKARQAALAALNAVKSAIQGIISACASAIRSIISACASLVRTLIQGLANMLKSLVQALTTLLQTLVQAFQAAVNALLDGLIAAVSLINKDLGDKLRQATQKYRDAFNNAMNTLQTGIQAAGQALQNKIQQAADGAIAVVNQAEQTLNAAVTRVEQTLNAAVEAAYQVGAAAINKAFDAAEAVVNKAFDVAEAAVKAYFDAQIAALDLVQQGVNAVADFVVAVADKVLEAVAKIAEAIIDMIPESWTKAFVDFWNGPWRQAIIIGLATVAAVAITVATCGAAGPVAMILIAGLIGGTIAGTAYGAGELLAREGAIDLTENHPGEGVYVPGVGNVQIQIGPDGKPIPPANLTPEQQAAWEKNSQWALSNFNTQRDAEGNVTGYDRKSGSEIANAAVQEGIKGFGEGFISAAGAMGGSLAGGAVAGLGFVGRIASNPVARQMIAGVVEGGVGVVSQSVGAGWTAGFDAIAEGKSPGEAFSAAWKAGSDSITDPGNWVAGMASVGVIPLKTKAIAPLLDRATGRVANQAVKTVIHESVDVAVDTMAETIGNAGGAFTSAYYKAIQEGKSPAEAMSAGRTAAADSFSPEAIAQSLVMNAAGNRANKAAENYAARHAQPGNPNHDPVTSRMPDTDPTPDGVDAPASTTRPPAAETQPRVDNTPHADNTPQPRQADGTPTPDNNPRTTRGGDESNPTPRTTDSDSTEVIRNKPPAGADNGPPVRHSDDPAPVRTKPGDPVRQADGAPTKPRDADVDPSRPRDADVDPTRPRDGESNDRAIDVEPTKDGKSNRQVNESTQTSLDGHTFEMKITDVSPEARHVIRQLEANGTVRVADLSPEALVEASKWFGKEVAVVQSPVGNLRIVLGETNKVLASQLKPGEVYVVHTHPVMRTTKDHFGTDLQNCGVHTEAVIDWNGQFTYYSKSKSTDSQGKIHNPVADFDGKTVLPLEGYRAAFMGPDGRIVGFAKVDVVPNADGGSTIKVREMTDGGPTSERHIDTDQPKTETAPIRTDGDNTTTPKQDQVLKGDDGQPVRSEDSDASRQTAEQKPTDSQDGKRFQDRETDQTRVDQQMQNGHSGIEVHSHFMGNVDPANFAAAIARSGDAPMRKPNENGKTAAERVGDSSPYEPVMREIAKLDELRHTTTEGPDGQQVISQRGRSGDALAQIDAATQRIETLKQKLATEGDTMSPEQRRDIEQQIHNEARSAVEKALRASDETDFNSAYEVRDELVKKFYGADVRKGLGIEPGSKITDPGVADKYREHYASQVGPDGKPLRQDIVDRVDKAIEAQRKLDSGVEMSKGERAQAKKDAGALQDQIAYDAYAKETIARLAEDGITYTEQSNSINKLAARFDPGQIEAMKMQLREEYAANPRMLEAINNLEIKHVAMINTNMFGVRGDSHRGGDAQVNLGDLHPAANTARGADRTKFNAEVDALIGQVKRGDVVGVDIAGAEHFTFDGEGQARMTELYNRLLSDPEVPKPIVLRPHVGEGANDTIPGMPGHRDANRQMVDGPNGPELSHYARARENLDGMLKVFEAIAARPENNGKLPPDVIVRFGHATHTTPEMAARMAKLGIIAEVNLTSNIETGSVSQKNAADPANKQDNVYQPKPEDARTQYEIDPAKRQGGSLDDHAFTALVAADAPIILSTDAHSVMSTNMANEYRRASDLINEVRDGKRQVPIDQSVLDPSLPPGKTVNLSYDQMPPHLKERFDNAQRKLYEDANRYFDMRPKQGGEDGQGGTPAKPVNPDNGPQPRRVDADDFEMANLAKSTNDADKLAQRAQFNTKMADQTNSVVDQLRAGRSVEEIYQDTTKWRASLESDPQKRAKLETAIQEGDPNFDPFGDMPGKIGEDGKPTQEMLQRQETAKAIAQRFEGVNGDVIQTKIELPDGTVVDGNKLHRGESANEINSRKGNKYGYDEGSAKFITETASPADQAKLHEAGVKQLDRLLAQKQDLANATPAQRAKAMQDFADAAYMLFHGPVINRGSDSTIRVVLTAAFTETFGHPPRLPQDIDIRAYSKDQTTFRAEISKVLADQYAVAQTARPKDRNIDFDGKPAATRKPQNESEVASQKQIDSSTDLLRQKFGDRLDQFDTNLTPPPEGKRVLQQNPNDALIGLPADVIPANMSGAEALSRLQTDGIPRWGGLTAKERMHETAFADHLEQNLPAAIDEFTKRSFDQNVGTHIFEVDAAKKLYEAYGSTKKPEGADQLDVRATANHAMHPAAVAIARVAFLSHLDTMANLPDGDPRKSVFVTNGGCAAGKGSLSEIVKGQNGDKFEFGAVWDAAGEGDAQENGWILQAAQQRGLKVTYGFVENDPMFTYNAVLNRAAGSGRIVDPLTFSRSYVRGQENMRAFLDSPEYKQAVADGQAGTIGVYTGKFDTTTNTYPNSRLLGDNGKITVDDMPAALNESQVTTKAVDIFEQFLADQKAKGEPTDHWFEGGAVNPLKFGTQEGTETSAPIRERKDTGGTLPVVSQNRPKDIPTSVPGTREEVRGFVRDRYKDVVGPQEAHPKRSSPEYQALIDELATFKPGELGKPENKEKAKELIAKWTEISKTIEGGPDESGLRDLYNRVEKGDFPKWIESISHLPKQQQAELCHMYREELKAYVREMMTDAKSVEVLNLRDRAVYGSEKGPSFDTLFQKALKKTNGDTEAAYDEIIGSSQRSNKDVNQAITGSETGLKPKDDGPIKERREPPTRPLSPADRATITKVQEQIASMKITPVIDPANPHQKQIGIGFDGTGNDRAKMEHDTNVSKLLEDMDGATHYERGVATDGDFMDTFDYATGAGLQDRVNAVYSNLVEQVNAMKSADPNAEVVLAVTGFSRGATSARVFVNELARRGVPVTDSLQRDGTYAAYHETPKVGVMVLFDTVQMTAKRYDTSIPENVGNVLHLTAGDEHRQIFPLTRATSAERPNPNITEVALPGSHGDIGGGMNNAYSNVSLDLARQYMERAGVKFKPGTNEPVDLNDPALKLHDTGRLFGLDRRAFDAPIHEKAGTEASRDAADAIPPTREIRPELRAQLEALKPGQSIDLGRRGGKDGLVEYLRHQSVEYGVFKDRDGNYYVMMGTVDSLTPRDMSDRLIAHNHPGGTPRLSPDDVDYINQSSNGKQRATLLLTPGEDGGVSRHYVADYTQLTPEADATKGPIREVPERTPSAESVDTLLKAKGKKLEDYAGKPTEMKALAKELLTAKKITQPTESQLAETLFQLDKAIKKGDTSFEAPFEAGAIVKADGVNERLGNIFGEKRVFGADELTSDRLKMSPTEAAALQGGFESGVAGQVRAASFINGRHRSEGDFSHAYGADGWKNQLRAETYLNSIPKGTFIDGLSVEVMQEVNRLIHTPDTGMKAQMLRGLAFIGRGFKWDVGGEIRDGNQYARPEHYTDEEIANLNEAGVGTRKLPGMGFMGHQLQYPAPERIRPRLNEMIAELKTNLAKPDADQVGAAAQFQRHFVALHPFGDSNGRTSRALMNRILLEFDLPPAIFADQNADMSLSPAAWREEVAKGVARSKAYLGTAGRNSKDGYIGAITKTPMATASPNKPIAIDNLPFDLGADGFLYDPMGRPYMVQNDELIPMSQLEHYMMSRRIASAGKDAAPNLLASTNESTRQFYDRIAADPDAAKSAKVRDDARARKADQEYRMAPDPEVAEMLAKLTDMSALDPTKAFSFNQGGGYGSQTGSGTRNSAVMSKYTQMDLELWYIEKGLRDAKHPELIEQVRANRAKLFEAARGEMLKTSDATRVSPENPQGFKFKYEKMMYDTSPLRFASFDEAIHELGDKRMTVWRGDYSFSKWLGMAPNNDVRQPDAKAVADQRAQKNQITDLYDDLVKLESSAVGRQYICTTSDLALLMGAFASSQKAQTVSLSALPAPVRSIVLGWMAPNFPPGISDADKQKAYDEAKTRKDKVITAPDGTKEIRDFAGIPGSILRVKVLDAASGSVSITAERKAFQIDLDKDAFLPGIYSLGGPTFEAEQELHGLETVRPWKIKNAHEASSLKEEFPVTSAPAAAPAPTVPSDGGGVGFGEGGDDQVHGEGRGEVGAPAAPTQTDAAPTTGATVDWDTEWNAADGSGTKRSSVGVGEKVYFSADADGAWSATGGTRTGRGQQFDWTAPGTAGGVTVTFTPTSGTAVQKTLTVVAPTSIVLTKTSDDTFASGTVGAGFVANVAFHPMNVSFAATQWKEDTGQRGTAATGAFTGRRAPALPVHAANPNWLGIGADNSGPTDHAAFSFTGVDFSAGGSFQWSIAQRWKLRTAAAAGGLIDTLAQTCVIEGNPHAGRTTVSKGGASSTRSPSGPSGGGGGGGSAPESEGRANGVGYAEDGPTSSRAFGEGLSSEGAPNQAESLEHHGGRGGAGVGFGTSTGVGESAAKAPATTPAAAVTPAAAAEALLVDAGPTTAAQMTKAAFLAKLQQQVIAVANAELGRLAAAAGCPYIEQAFAKYGNLPAASGLAMLARWVPASKTAKTADELIPMILDRVTSGVKQWKASGSIPSDLAAADPALAKQAQSHAQQKGVGLGSLDQVEAKLGDGEQVDQRVARGMAEATGVDVSDARVHRGATAEGMAAEQDAAAFAVGKNVVMGSGAPAAGTGLGDLLLAHELAHVAQQKDAASDSSQRKKQIGEEEQAAEKDANKAAGSGLAAMSNLGSAMGDVMRTGVQLQRCATEQAKELNSKDYLATHEHELAATAADQIETFPFKTGDAAATWTAGGMKKFAGSLAAQIRGGDANLREIIQPEHIGVLLDSNRVMTQKSYTDLADGQEKTQSTNAGPDRYFEGAGISLANAIARRANESLRRETPRYIQAKLATVGEPTPTGLLVGHPIDPLILVALTAGGVIDINQDTFAKEHPELKGSPKLIAPLPAGALVQETDPKRKNWYRLTLASPVPAEQVALTLLKDQKEAYRIEVAHPLYGVKQWGDEDIIANLHDDKQDAFLDEIALNQAKTLPGADADAVSGGVNGPAEIIAQIRTNALVVRTSVHEAASALGYTGLAAWSSKLTDRANRLEKGANDNETRKWGVHANAQFAIINQAAKGLEADRGRQRTYAAQFGGKDANVHAIPEQNQQALFDDAKLWTGAIEASDAVKTAEAMLNTAFERSATLDMDILEQQLGMPQNAADLPNQDKDSQVNKDMDPASLGTREIALRKRIALMRQQTLTDPSQIDKSADTISEDTRRLVFESNVVMQAEQMDQQWRILDDVSGFWASVTGDGTKIDNLKKQGKGFYTNWQEVYALVKAKEIDKAQQKYEALVRRLDFQKFLGTVQQSVREAQAKQMIAKLITMVVITIVSMGVGTIVEGLVGGGAAIAGAAEGTAVVSAGLGASRTAAAVAGFIAETGTFTLASNLLLSKDHSATAILGEFAKNIAIFGAMRGLGKMLEVAGVGKIVKAGAAPGASTGAVVKAGAAKFATEIAMGGAGVLAGVIEAKIAAAIKGQSLTDAQMSQIIHESLVQAVIMTIVGRVLQSPMRTLKIAAAQKGSKWRAAEMQAAHLEALTAPHTGDKPQMTREQLRELIQKDMEQIQAEKAAFEEVRASMLKEGKSTKSIDDHLSALDKFGDASASSLLMVGLKAKAPNHFTAPVTDIPVLKAQHEKLGSKFEELPAKQGEPQTYKVTNAAGESFFITAELPAWTRTTSGQHIMEAAKKAGLDDGLIAAMTEAERMAILKLERAVEKADQQAIAKAKEALAKLNAAQRDALEKVLGENKARLASIRKGKADGSLRSASELSDKDVADVMNAQMQQVKTGEIDAMVGDFPPNLQELARQVLARSSGFAAMDSMSAMRAALEPHLAANNKLYVPRQGSLADNVLYMSTKKNVTGATPLTAEGMSPVGYTDTIGPNTVVILDGVVLAKIKSDPVFAKSLKDNGAILLEPRGFVDGVNMFNSGTPEAIAAKTKTITTKAKAALDANPKLTPDEAISQALDQSTLKTLKDAGLEGQLKVVDPAEHAGLSSDAIAKQLNGEAGITPDKVEAIMSMVKESERPMLRELLAQQSEIYSARRMATALAEQHAKIMALAGGKDVYYYIFKPDKSYDMLAMAYREANGTGVNQFIGGPAELGKAITSGKFNADTILVVLDDVAGSGDSLQQATNSARGNNFRGKIVIAPMVSASDATVLFEGKPGKPGITTSDPNVTYMPGQKMPTIKDSPLYQHMDPLQQKRFVELLTDLGFSLDKTGPKTGNGLSMVFPYMAPDNNNYMFGDQVAPEFIVNKNKKSAKSGKWDPQ